MFPRNPRPASLSRSPDSPGRLARCRGGTTPLLNFFASFHRRYTIQQFSVEIDVLLDLTLSTRLVETLAVAVNKCVFSSGRVLETSEHNAIIAVHGFLQNLYLCV